jgi:putative endonuclease
MKGWMYILLCNDGTYYTGSTNSLTERFKQHQNGEGANHTKRRLPVELIYYEEFDRVDDAFTGKSRYRVGAEIKRKH